MSEITLSAISKIETGGSPVSAGEILAAQANPPPAEKPAEVKKAEAQAPAPVFNTDVRLKFQVDGETHDITVYVVDKATNRIIRTIPPEELGKLDSGNLLELFA